MILLSGMPTIIRRLTSPRNRSNGVFLTWMPFASTLKHVSVDTPHNRFHSFLREELTWGQTKVDDLLVPIIQKMGRRGQVFLRLDRFRKTNRSKNHRHRLLTDRAILSVTSTSLAEAARMLPDDDRRMRASVFSRSFLTFERSRKLPRPLLRLRVVTIHHLKRKRQARQRKRRKQRRRLRRSRTAKQSLRLVVQEVVVEAEGGGRLPKLVQAQRTHQTKGTRSSEVHRHEM